MKTTEKTTEESLLLRIAERLAKMQQELDDLAVQFALGKAEAKDKFEEAKTEFKKRVQEAKTTLETSEWRGKLDQLKDRFEELEAELVEVKDANKVKFEWQYSRIVQKLEALEYEIEDKVRHLPGWQEFQYEMEKFKLKMELIRLKFALKKFVLKEDIDSGLYATRIRFEKILQTGRAKIHSGKEKLEDFKDELQSAYKHMRDSLSQL